MSETETHRGKLVPMVLSGVTLEERCESACNELGYEMGKYCDTWEECLSDDGYKKVIIRDKVIYRIVDDVEVPSDGFAEATANEDGSINYFISWYNGGASMDEVINSAIDELDGDL